MFCAWIIIIVQAGKTPLQLAQEDVEYTNKDEIRKFLESYLQEVHKLFVMYK